MTEEKRETSVLSHEQIDDILGLRSASSDQKPTQKSSWAVGIQSHGTDQYKDKKIVMSLGSYTRTLYLDEAQQLYDALGDSIKIFRGRYQRKFCL